MTPDIRTAAEDAMIRANAVEPLVVVEGEEAVMQLTDYGNGFIAGAAWAAARVTPTREQVAEVLMRHGFNALGQCTCGYATSDYGSGNRLRVEEKRHFARALCEAYTEGKLTK